MIWIEQKGLCSLYTEGSPGFLGLHILRFVRGVLRWSFFAVDNWASPPSLVLFLYQGCWYRYSLPGVQNSEVGERWWVKGVGHQIQTEKHALIG